MSSPPPVTQALVLAGGQGTRLRPLTHEVPKPMVPFEGTPFLELLLGWLRDRGVTDIVLSIGYLGEQVRDHFGDGTGFDVNIRYAVEDEPLGTGGGVGNARELLGERFYLLYGDTFLDVDLQRLAEAQTDLGTTGVLTAHPNRQDLAPANNLVVTPGPDTAPWGRVERYDKEHETEAMNGVEAGVSLWTRDVLDAIPPGKVSLEQEVYPKLIEAGELGALWTNERFYDIGTPDRLNVARRMLGGTGA